MNTCDDITRWWEVVDRTAGRVVPPQDWSYDEKSGNVVVSCYTNDFTNIRSVFSPIMIWDPVHMYNAVTNGWKDVEHQITFDVRQPKTHKFTMERLRRFICRAPVCERHPLHHVLPPVHAGVRRAGSGRNMWTGTAIPPACRPYILEQFEREAGYQVPAGVHHRPGLLQQPVPRALAGNSGISRPSSAARWQSWPKRWWTSPTSRAKRP